MATILPPPPVQDAPGSFTWMEWYRRLRNYITQNGSVPWSIIDFAGSSLSDLANRPHSALQAIQGGTANQHYHLTQAQHTALTAGFTGTGNVVRQTSPTLVTPVHQDSTLVRTSVPLTNAAAAQTATLTNAPVAGNPTKWIPIDDNGTIRYIPVW